MKLNEIKENYFKELCKKSFRPFSEFESFFNLEWIRDNHIEPGTNTGLILVCSQILKCEPTDLMLMHTETDGENIRRMKKFMQHNNVHSTECAKTISVHRTFHNTWVCEVDSVKFCHGSPAHTTDEFFVTCKRYLE